ncbi:MAG: hypothetical protein JW891_17395 [Candidatus Lokiarchaeota archaeon]|nr:hypothetical protein [Candidatus Lokiarchaeota archaeon]
MIYIRVRACLKCREYVEIEVDDISTKNRIYMFEGQHRGHALITCDLSEVESYTKVTPQLLEAPM